MWCFPPRRIRRLDIALSPRCWTDIGAVRLSAAADRLHPTAIDQADRPLSQARHLHPHTRASRTTFKSRFGTQDIALLAQLDALHNSLSGPAPHMQGMII